MSWLSSANSGGRLLMLKSAQRLVGLIVSQCLRSETLNLFPVPHGIVWGVLAFTSSAQSWHDPYIPGRNAEKSANGVDF